MPDAQQPTHVPRRVLFLLAAVFCATPWASTPLALALGAALALLGLSDFNNPAKRLSRLLIQACVIALGLRVDLLTIAREARSGFLFAAGTIIGAFLLGFILERLLRTGKELTLLVSSGTAICGGSAIAAVGASIGASASAMAVATGAVFILNAVALYVFPPIGHALHLTDAQFGLWAGVAIHDVSSVVGAASHYHAGDPTSAAALDTANVVKLTRVLWILPCALFASWVMRRGGSAARTPFPWFILLFLVASAARTFIPPVALAADTVKIIATLGFQLALFLIGSGLSKAAIASVGWRVLLQAVLMWLAVAGVSLSIIVRAG